MNLQDELKRKSLHLLLILIPIAFCLLGQKIFLSIIIPISIIIVSLDYYRRKNLIIQQFFLKIFSTILRPHELSGLKLCGASYVALSSSISFLLFPKAIAVIGFTILVISDTLASLIGKSVKSQPFFEKSFAGSMAFFISAILILFFLGWLFEVKILFYLFGLISIIFITGLEARPSIIGIDDNFVIPIGFGIAMYFFNFMWNFI